MADLRTISALRKDGLEALARAAYDQARRRFERALEALGQLSEDRQTLEYAVDLRLELRAALLPLGQEARILPLLQEAAEFANALHDVCRLGRIADYMTVHHWFMGNPDLAVVSGQKAQRLAASCKVFSLQVSTHYHLGLALYTLGQYQQGLEIFTKTTTALTGESRYQRFGLSDPPAITSRAYLACCLTEIGAFDKARAIGQEAVQIATTVGKSRGLLAAYRGLIYLYLRQGDLAKALPLIQQGLQLCQKHNHTRYLGTFAAALGYTLALSGRQVESLSPLRQATEHLTAVRTPAGHALQIVWLGEGYLVASSYEEALAYARQAHELAQAHKEYGALAWSLRLLGALTSIRGPSEFPKTETYFHQALALATKLDMRPLIAHCHQGLGNLYSQTTRVEETRSELSLAIDMYRAMDMRFWLSRTGTALAR